MNPFFIEHGKIALLKSLQNSFVTFLLVLKNYKSRSTRCHFTIINICHKCLQ